LFLCFFKTSNIFPLHIWNFNVSLSKRCGINWTHSEFEMFLCYTHGLENGCIYLLGLDIYDVHLFSDALQGWFCAESGNIRTNKTMSVFCNSFKINIFRKFHIFSVYTKNLKSTYLIRHSNIDLSVKSTESSKSWIEGIRSISSSNNNNMSSSFKTVHESEKLRNNSSFDLTTNLFSVRSNRIDLIDEDNCRTVLFSLFKCFSKISFSLSSHFRHNFRAVD